jgi:hypothetical protein
LPEGGDSFTQQTLAVTEVAAESDCDGNHGSQVSSHKSQIENSVVPCDLP